MSFPELFMVAVGLSMDAFAVAVCKGLAMSRMSWRDAALVGAYFGGFQALMPLLGYLLGTGFKGVISAYCHWIAFGLLALIGINMMREALAGGEDEAGGSLDLPTMAVLSIATSIDALAVGITLAFFSVPILPAVCLIGLTAFLLSIGGVRAGNLFGRRYQSKAELAGGAVLILIGFKILFEHLGRF